MFKYSKTNWFIIHDVYKSFCATLKNIYVLIFNHQNCDDING